MGEDIKDFEEQFKLLLLKEWNDEEKNILKKMIESLCYYKRILPKALKKDIASALQICNDVKCELEEFQKTCTCKKELL